MKTAIKQGDLFPTIWNPNLAPVDPARIFMRRELITPVMAEAMLKKNSFNRPERPGIECKYADDMLTGRWTRCDEPIQFYEDGHIANGQNRLRAIVMSNTSQWFFVTYGMKREEGKNIDTGAPRTATDAAHILGDKKFSTTFVSAARGIIYGSTTYGRSVPMSTGQTIDMVNEQREAVEWVAANVRRKRGLCGGTVLGAVGRAYIAGVDREKLARFCEVLASGFADGDKESAAIAIRNYLLDKGSASSYVSEWYDTFLRVQNAIHYFVAGTKLTKLNAIHVERYPLKSTAVGCEG